MVVIKGRRRLIDSVTLNAANFIHAADSIDEADVTDAAELRCAA